MSITDELRTGGIYRFPSNRRVFTEEELTAIADRIDAEHEAKVSYWQGASYRDGYDEGFASADDWLGQHEDAMAEHGWVKLPKDANGVPICVGDVLTDGEHTFVVDELAAFGGGSWSIRNEDGSAWKACDVTHHHEPTVEDVLREFAYGLGVPVADSYIAASAAKLRLAGDAE